MESFLRLQVLALPFAVDTRKLDPFCLQPGLLHYPN
jgi:hypothetical protein